MVQLACTKTVWWFSEALLVAFACLSTSLAQANFLCYGFMHATTTTTATCAAGISLVLLLLVNG
jgi:hypothetical protein